MCLICMKYRILILIIIIISLGEILLSYIANTSRTQALAHARTHALGHVHTQTRAHTHTRTHAHTHPFPFRFDASVAPTRDEVNALIHGRYLGHSHKHTRWRPDFPKVFDVFRVKTLLGRTETRPRDWMYCQTIQRHLPRRSSKNCDLQFANADRQTDLRIIIV